jgi:hypothetical protein
MNVVQVFLVPFLLLNKDFVFMFVVLSVVSVENSVDIFVFDH